jgi:hypothetical protein
MKYVGFKCIPTAISLQSVGENIEFSAKNFCQTKRVGDELLRILPLGKMQGDPESQRVKREE